MPIREDFDFMCLPVGHKSMVRSPAIAYQIPAFTAFLDIQDTDHEHTATSRHESSILEPQFLDRRNLRSFTSHDLEKVREFKGWPNAVQWDFTRRGNAAAAIKIPGAEHAVAAQVPDLSDCFTKDLRRFNV